MQNPNIEEVLAVLREMEARLAVQQALLDERLLRVENNRLFTAWSSVTGMAMRLWRRLRPVEDDRPITDADYRIWVAHEQAALPGPEEARGEVSAWSRRPFFSILTAPTSASPGLQTQIYPEWEQVEIGAAENARGEYLVFTAPDGSLSPLALYHLAQAIQDGSPDMLYGDEDSVNEAGERVRPVFRPGWSPELLKSCMYPGRLIAVRRDRFLSVGGLRVSAGDAVLHDLALRLAGTRPVVKHVPHILYHSATHMACGPSLPATTPAVAGAEATAIVCSRTPALLRTCLSSLRANGGAVIRDIIVVAHEDTGRNEELRSVAASAGATVLPYTGVFNFSAMNNLAAAQAATPLILFLNDDVEATRSGWASSIAACLQQPETAIAGATLWYPDRVLQHAGIAAGIHDGVGHVGRHQKASSLWPWLLMTRNVSAVTGACLGIRTAVFRELGGFDPLFPNNYNDVDLCFRARARGYEVVCVNVEGLIHSECRTRRGIVHFAERYRFFTRWRDVLSQPDPYYSASLLPSENIALNLSREAGIRSILASPESHGIQRGVR